MPQPAEPVKNNDLPALAASSTWCCSALRLPSRRDEAGDAEDAGAGRCVLVHACGMLLSNGGWIAGVIDDNCIGDDEGAVDGDNTVPKHDDDCVVDDATAGEEDDAGADDDSVVAATGEEDDAGVGDDSCAPAAAAADDAGAHCETGAIGNDEVVDCGRADGDCGSVGVRADTDEAGWVLGTDAGRNKDDVGRAVEAPTDRGIGADAGCDLQRATVPRDIDVDDALEAATLACLACSGVVDRDRDS